MNRTFTKRSIALAAFGLALSASVAALSWRGLSPTSQGESFQRTPSAVPVSTQKADRWSELDAFKHGLPALLRGSDSKPEEFNIHDLALQLSRIRVGGFATCTTDEVSADQYILLSDIAGKLLPYKHATTQFNALLDAPDGVTDCQFRILENATAQTH